MEAIGMVIFALGFIGLVWGIFQKLRAGRVLGAPFVKTGEAAAKGTEVAAPNGAISAEGKVICATPLTSPVTGVQCLFYEIKCTATWKEGEVTKTRELEKRKVAADVQIDDGSGPVRIDLRDGGDFEPTQNRDETKSTGLLGGITGKDIQFGNYTVSAGALSLGTKYRVEEQVFPVEQRLYVCGKAIKGGAIGAPGLRQIIASNRTRDEILSKATAGAKAFLLGGAGAVVVGLGVAIAGHFLFGSSAGASTAVAKTTEAKTTEAKTADAPAASPAPAPETAPTNQGASDPSPGGHHTEPAKHGSKPEPSNKSDKGHGKK